MLITNDSGFKKFLTNIGAKLKAIRMAKGIAIQTVSRTTGITPDTLEQIENGRYNWRVKQIERLCMYYEVTIREITTEKTIL